MRKKIIVISALLALTLAISGCAGNNTEDITVTESSVEDTKNTEKETIVEEIPAENTVSDTETEEKISDTTTESEAIIEETQSPEEITVKGAMPYNKTEVDEIVYVNTFANVRRGPSTDFDVAGTLNVNDEIHRVGILDNGWSEIEYNSEICFINSKLVQANKIEIPEQNTEVVSVQVSGDLCVGLAKEVFDATNAERVAAGLNALTWNDNLAIPAQTRSLEIVTTFSHTRPDGSNWNTVSSLVKGENLLRGPSLSASEIMAAWMGSEGHKKNILYKDYKSIGIAIFSCEQGMTVVQCFGY